MSSTKQPSRVIFIGNIPYGLSEQQIIDLFSSAGEVLNFRLVYDPQTGKARGYGFAEYPDIDSASSAVRNLHDHEIMNRKLRVDFSNERPTHEAADDSSAPASAPAMSSMPPSNGSSSLPPLPAGKELPPGVTCHDAISRTLNALPPSQLLDILTQMKLLATNEPSRCAELLAQAPQLSYAVFQALLLMGLVSPEAIHTVIEPSGAAPYPIAAPPPMPVPPVATNTPPVPFNAGAGGYGMPAPPPAAVPQPAMAAGQEAEALMRQVMELPQETIDQLPKTERDQIMALRAQFGAQRR